MVNKGLLFGIIGFLVGGLVASSAAVLMDDEAPLSQANAQMQTEGHGKGGTSAHADDPLHGLTGDDFDKAFLAEMIVHHEGAVHMAGEARANARHQEIRDMADSIEKTQKAEIGQMRQWQQEWDY
jgi:uncharacterized protein (DUF305 family)